MVTFDPLPSGHVIPPGHILVKMLADWCGRLVWFETAAAQRRKNRAHVVRFIGGIKQSVTIRYDIEQRGGRHTTSDDGS